MTCTCSRTHQNNFTKLIFFKSPNCPYPLTKSEKVMEVTRVVLSETKSFKDTFENEDVTRDTESSFLVVAVLLSRLVEEFHED